MKEKQHRQVGCPSVIRIETNHGTTTGTKVAINIVASKKYGEPLQRSPQIRGRRINAGGHRHCEH